MTTFQSADRSIRCTGCALHPDRCTCGLCWTSRERRERRAVQDVIEKFVPREMRFKATRAVEDPK